MECDLWSQDKQVTPEAEFETLEDEVYSTIEEIFNIRDQEETIETEQLKTIVQQKEIITDQDDLQRTKQFDRRSGSEEMKPCAPEWDWDLESTSCDSCESYVLEGEVDPYGLALPFKRGDKMEAIPPENIR